MYGYGHVRVTWIMEMRPSLLTGVVGNGGRGGPSRETHIVCYCRPHLRASWPRSALCWLAARQGWSVMQPLTFGLQGLGCKGYRLHQEPPADPRSRCLAGLGRSPFWLETCAEHCRVGVPLILLRTAHVDSSSMYSALSLLCSKEADRNGAPLPLNPQGLRYDKWAQKSHCPSW